MFEQQDISDLLLSALALEMASEASVLSEGRERCVKEQVFFHSSAEFVGLAFPNLLVLALPFAMIPEMSDLSMRAADNSVLKQAREKQSLTINHSTHRSLCLLQVYLYLHSETKICNI